MAADFKLTPDQIIEIRRMLEAEERTGYDDSAIRRGNMVVNLQAARMRDRHPMPTPSAFVEQPQGGVEAGIDPLPRIHQETDVHGNALQRTARANTPRASKTRMKSVNPTQNSTPQRRPNTMVLR